MWSLLQDIFFLQAARSGAKSRSSAREALIQHADRRWRAALHKCGQALVYSHSRKRAHSVWFEYRMRDASGEVKKRLRGEHRA